METFSSVAAAVVLGQNTFGGCRFAAPRYPTRFGRWTFLQIGFSMVVSSAFILCSTNAAGSVFLSSVRSRFRAAPSSQNSRKSHASMAIQNTCGLTTDRSISPRTSSVGRTSTTSNCCSSSRESQRRMPSSSHSTPAFAMNFSIRTASERSSLLTALPKYGARNTTRSIRTARSVGERPRNFSHFMKLRQPHNYQWRHDGAHPSGLTFWRRIRTDHKP